jgi:hypothetical protein
MGLGSGIQDPRSGIRDPRSGIRDPGSELQDPGSGKKLFRIQGSKGTGSRIRICNTMSFYESFIHCNCMRGGDHYSQHPVMSLLKKHLQNYVINSIKNCYFFASIQFFFFSRVSQDFQPSISIKNVLNSKFQLFSIHVLCLMTSDRMFY